MKSIIVLEPTLQAVTVKLADDLEVPLHFTSAMDWIHNQRRIERLLNMGLVVGIQKTFRKEFESHPKNLV